MIILLLTLFAIALIITFAGLFLSPKNNQPPVSRKTTHSPTRTTVGHRTYGYVPTGNTTKKISYATQNMRGRRSVELKRTPFSTNRGSIFASLNVKSLFETRSGQPTPWLGILVVLVALFSMGLVSMRAVLPNTGLMVSAAWIAAPPAVPTPVPTAAPVHNPTLDLMNSVSGASKALTRVSQLEPNQYASAEEFDKWAYSACSAASMTEVINAYGHNYRVTDILNVEARIGEITPEQGLLEPTGIDHTVAKFDFKMVPLPSQKLDDIVTVANQGHPVIISFPPDRWDGGHILVLRGGDANTIYLADSSKLNMTFMARDKFLKYWGGFAVVAVPKDM